MRAFARANDDSREKERESGWTWAQVREHRKGVAVRVPLNEERKRYGNRGLGPRGGTSRSSQTAKHVRRPRGRVSRERPHTSLFLSLSLSLLLSVSLSRRRLFFFVFFNQPPIPVASFTHRARVKVVKKRRKEKVKERGKCSSIKSILELDTGSRRLSSVVQHDARATLVQLRVQTTPIEG